MQREGGYFILNYQLNIHPPPTSINQPLPDYLFRFRASKKYGRSDYYKMTVFLKNNRILVYIKNMSFEGEGGGLTFFYSLDRG